AQSTGASIENINLLAAGDVDLIIVQNDLSDYAVNGTEFFKDRKIGNLTAIARLYPETIHVVASKASGIKTFADFKGKNISVGAPGSGNEANARQIFDVYGLSYDALKPHFISYAETTDHFKDRLVDAFLYTTGTPNPSIQDISTLQDIVFVPIDGEMRNKLIEKYPFFAKDVLPGKTYRGQDEPVETVAVQAILAARKELSEEVVYTITKALFQNLEALGNSHHKGKSVKISQALDGISVPVHPGAIKFYKEVGLMK
ncbi:MAG: TAXI family TRAP transporter solute-binding subunit, partial [Synergistales bacterium]|nr:TAXI family TRAP transporter solute-binding subunit [Synergistales bacterium]